MTDSNRWNLALRWTALATTLLGACADDLGRSGNRSPQFPTALFVTDEDVPVDLHLLDGVTDPDGDTLTVTRAVAPGHGVELLAGGVVRLTPATDVYGNVDITYDINDGVNFLTRRVIVSVRPVNDAPVGVGDTLAVVRRGNFALRASDIEHDSLSYEVVTRPVHGTLEGAAPALGYLANLGFVGEDAFTFRVFDGTAWSEAATFHLQVAAGSAPQAFDGSAAGAEEVCAMTCALASDEHGVRRRRTAGARPLPPQRSPAPHRWCSTSAAAAFAGASYARPGIALGQQRATTPRHRRSTGSHARGPTGAGVAPW